MRCTKSGGHAGSVSQNQIRQCEHDIEFCLRFSEFSVSGLLEFKETFHDTEDMFYLCSYRGFCVFPFLGFVFATSAEFADLAWTTIDSVLDLLTGFVPYDCILGLLSANISAVTVSNIFSVQKTRSL